MLLVYIAGLGSVDAGFEEDDFDDELGDEDSEQAEVIIDLHNAPWFICELVKEDDWAHRGEIITDPGPEEAAGGTGPVDEFFADAKAQIEHVENEFEEEESHEDV